jgi:hypothetical protein
MSNFIRYILYRSQDFRIVSVDNLKKPSDIKRIYFHNNHRFCIGDPSDAYFMDRIIFVEKPDIILCGDETLEYEKYLKTSLNLSRYNMPLIQISPIIVHGHNDIYNMYISTEKILTWNNNGSVVRLPHRFGMRQRFNMVDNLGINVAYYMDCILNNKQLIVNDVKLPCVYAEDVASFLWYVIENYKTGKTYYMPKLGIISSEEIAIKIVNMYNLKPNYQVERVEQVSFGDIYKHIEWVPDSESLDSSLEKTIRWFDANRWAFNE